MAGPSARLIIPVGAAAAALAVSFAAFVPNDARGDPLPTRNQNPLLAIYGLPAPLPSRLPAKGGGSAAFVLNWANSMTTDTTSDSSFVLDAETQDWRLTLDYGVTDRIAVRAELPWRDLSGGSLDGFIEDWHRFWHLPNGDRKSAPRNRLLIAYVENGNELLHIDESGAGLGDIPIAVGYQLAASEKTALAAWLTVKLPTGDVADLTGSEATDVALSLAGQTQLAARWQLFGQVDVAWLGSGRLLPKQQEDFAWAGLAGVTWNVWRGLDLTAQFAANSKVFDVSGTHLTGDAVVLSFGGSYRTAGGWRYDLGFGEDIEVEASPDITINLAVSHGF